MPNYRSTNRANMSDLANELAKKPTKEKASTG
jgi:hypothetical protein